MERDSFGWEGNVSLASRLGLVQQMFTDGFIGPSGALASVGIAFDW